MGIVDALVIHIFCNILLVKYLCRTKEGISRHDSSLHRLRLSLTLVQPSSTTATMADTTDSQSFQQRVDTVEMPSDEDVQWLSTNSYRETRA